MNIDDIKVMYEKQRGGEITLWCNGRKISDSRKRKRDEGSSKYREREEDLDEIFSQLKKKHIDKFDIPKLRLWARMIILMFMTVQTHHQISLHLLVSNIW